jgi:hypothetical protein
LTGAPGFSLKVKKCSWTYSEFGGPKMLYNFKKYLPAASFRVLRINTSHEQAMVIWLSTLTQSTEYKYASFQSEPTVQVFHIVASN